MSSTLDLVHALKAELRSAGITYAALAREMGLAESSVKRIFAKGDMPLSRIDEVLKVLKMDFAELAARVVHAQPLRKELTLEQEKAVVADRKLLLIAISVLSRWSLEQIEAATPGYSAFRVAAPAGTGTGAEQAMGNVVLWKSSTWTKVNGGRVQLVDDDKIGRAHV